MTRASGRFSCLHENGTGFRLQRLAYLIERKGLPVGGLHHVYSTAKGFRQCFPALAEFSGGEDEHAVTGRGQVGDGGFHGSRAGRGKKKHIIFSADEGLQL